MIIGYFSLCLFSTSYLDWVLTIFKYLTNKNLNRWWWITIGEWFYFFISNKLIGLRTLGPIRPEYPLKMSPPIPGFLLASWKRVREPKCILRMARGWLRPGKGLEDWLEDVPEESGIRYWLFMCFTLVLCLVFLSVCHLRCSINCRYQFEQCNFTSLLHCCGRVLLSLCFPVDRFIGNGLGNELGLGHCWVTANCYKARSQSAESSDPGLRTRNLSRTPPIACRSFPVLLGAFCLRSSGSPRKRVWQRATAPR